jgi:hypothetical protein
MARGNHGPFGTTITARTRSANLLDLAAMTSLKSLDDAPKTLKISRRQLQRWISAGRITRYKSEGDRKVYVDLDEVRKLRKPRPVPPRAKLG